MCPTAVDYRSVRGLWIDSHPRMAQYPLLEPKPREHARLVKGQDRMRHHLGRRQFLGSAALGAAGAILPAASLDALAAPLLPTEARQGGKAGADSGQRQQVEAFFKSFYQTKDALDAPAFAAHVADPNIYSDAVLSGHCGAPATRKEFQDRFAGIFKRFSGPGKFSTFVHATGDMRYGAMVEYVDVAGSIFEVDVDVLTVMEMKDGLVSRDTDYWDTWQLTKADIYDGGPVTKTGVALPLAPVHAGGKIRLQPTCTPREIPGDTPHASPEMLAFVRKFQAEMAAGNGDRVTGFFTDDAVFIHPMLHAGPPGYEGFARANAVKGRKAIAKALKAVLPLLPDGAHSSVVNVIGGSSGGGYEWKGGGIYAQQGLTREGIRGATALDLAGGRVQRMSVKFDTMHVTQEQRDAIHQALAKAGAL